MEDLSALGFSSEEGGFVVHGGLRVVRLPCRASATGMGVMGDDTQHGAVTPWAWITARVRGRSKSALSRQLGGVVGRHTGRRRAVWGVMWDMCVSKGVWKTACSNG